MPPKRTATTNPPNPMTDAQIRALIAQGVADALAEHDVNRSRNEDDNHDLGTGVRRQALVARECTYNDFLKCKPLNFKGTEGVGNALTWWNSHVKTVSNEVAYAMTWKTLKKMMTYKYCPIELALMYERMFPEESDEVEKYVGVPPDMIHGSVIASKPKIMQDAIEFATKLMDQKICTLAERQVENKRKFYDTLRNNQNQQQPFKRHNVEQAYIAGPEEKKPYGGSKPLYPKCNYHHDGQCAPKCTNCKRTGYSAHDWTNPNSNIVTGTFLLNNRYALILFDTGADRSLVSTAFSSLADIILTTLDHGYDILRIPFGNEILIVRGDGSNNGHESRLNITSCTKTQKYLLKGCQVFLAHITTKKDEDKSEEK
ncbi:putative reverse transcriptase domain-containing protein [Tanacetum coccineum]